MNQNRSVVTIDAPEFINLEVDALNPGISKCEVKVLYLGKNRNGSFIEKSTAIQMANSLPGTPIVGAYRKDIEDFGDHGEIMHIEDGEIEFSCKTIPYGFIAPDTKVWFQSFTDSDEFGNDTTREYLMSQGYLWTSQYPEAFECIESGKGQSMELDTKTLEGHWSTDNKTGIEFFIINDAIFTKLCILGDDVEPCFEGAAVTSPEVSKTFSNGDSFSRTLFTMMNELKDALQNKGGSDMPGLEVQQEIEIEEITETVAVEPAIEEVVSEEISETEEGDSDEAEDGEFACGGSKKKKKFADGKEEEEEDPDTKKNPKEEEPKDDPDKDDQKQKPAAKNSLETKVAELEAELFALRKFKVQQENLEKTALINKYHMLSAEDVKEIVENKEQYSLQEIEARLAVIYVNKNVNFSTLTGEEEEEEIVEDFSTTFSLDNDVAGFVPPVVEALRQAKHK